MYSGIASRNTILKCNREGANEGLALPVLMRTRATSVKDRNSRIGLQWPFFANDNKGDSLLMAHDMMKSFCIPIVVVCVVLLRFGIWNALAGFQKCKSTLHTRQRTSWGLWRIFTNNSLARYLFLKWGHLYASPTFGWSSRFIVSWAVLPASRNRTEEEAVYLIFLLTY